MTRTAFPTLSLLLSSAAAIAFSAGTAQAQLRPGASHCSACGAQVTPQRPVGA